MRKMRTPYSVQFCLLEISYRASCLAEALHKRMRMSFTQWLDTRLFLWHASLVGTLQPYKKTTMEDRS